MAPGGSNPYETPKAAIASQRPHPGNLRCPHCEHEFALTWKRYAKAPFGKHACPECGRKSKLGTGPIYWLLYFPALSAAPIILLFLALLAASAILGADKAVGFAFSDEGIWVTFATWLLIAASVLGLDRFLDTRWRSLHPVDGT